MDNKQNQGRGRKVSCEQAVSEKGAGLLEVRVFQRDRKQRQKNCERKRHPAVNSQAHSSQLAAELDEDRKDK